jgi:hypothetical protein
LEGLYLVAEGRGVGMIKCPHCGSTAQVELDDYIDDFCGSIQVHYDCGCGCHFYIWHEAKGEPIIEAKRDE